MIAVFPMTFFVKCSTGDLHSSTVNKVVLKRFLRVSIIFVGMNMTAVDWIITGAVQ
jgi:hypothetical protein